MKPDSLEKRQTLLLLKIINMSEIIIKITIPENEYKKWGDFEIDGIDTVKKNLKKDFTEYCNELGIDDCEIEVITQ